MSHTRTKHHRAWALFRTDGPRGYDKIKVSDLVRESGWTQPHKPQANAKSRLGAA